MSTVKRVSGNYVIETIDPTDRVIIKAGSTAISGALNTPATSELAELFSSDQDYEPGTVMSFGGSDEVTESLVQDDTAVAGVVSENASFVLDSDLDVDYPVALVLMGRVATKITGNVSKGDLMVSNGDGTAYACATPAIGTVLGKSLEDFVGATGVIDIVVGKL